VSSLGGDGRPNRGLNRLHDTGGPLIQYGPDTKQVPQAHGLPIAPVDCMLYSDWKKPPVHV